MFFEKPERQHDIDELSAKIDFPLPDAAETLADFLNSDDGALFRLGFKLLIDRLADWAKDYLGRKDQIDKILSVFANKYLNYDGSDRGLNTTYFPTYRQAVPYLLGVAELLDNTAIPIDLRQKQVIEIINALLKCFPGLYSRVFDAYTQMVSYLEVQEEFMAYRTELASNVALELIRALPAFGQSVHAGDEIHYANRVLQEFEDELCIIINEDTLNRGDIHVLKYLFALFPRAVSNAMSLETFIQYIISKLQLDESCKKADKGLREGNLPAFNDVVHDLTESMNRYGDGVLDSNKIFTLTEDCMSLRGVSYAAQAYLFAALIERLIGSELIEPKYFSFKKFNTISVRYCAYGSLHLASVKEDEQDPESFLEFYLQQLISGVPVSDLDKLIEEKNGDYYYDITNYFLGYLNQLDIDFTADQKHLPKDLAVVVDALVVMGGEYVDDVMKRLPRKLVIPYLLRLMHSEFPEGEHGSIAHEVLVMYALIGRENILPIVMGLMGHSVNLHRRVNDSGETLLHLVCQWGSEAIFENLLHTVSGLSVTNNEGVSPLMYACGAKNTGIVKAMLRLRPELAQATDVARLTPLHYAAMDGDEGIVVALLAHPVNIDARSICGFTPLQLAAYEGKLASVSYLLASGADPNVEDEEGNTILDIACQRKNIQLIYLLLSYKVEVDARSRQFGYLYNLLCVTNPGEYSKPILIAALAEYIRQGDYKIANGCYSQLDITKTAEQNFRMFSTKMLSRYDKARVASILLQRLTDRDTDHDQPLSSTEEEDRMFNEAYKNSKTLARFIRAYKLLLKTGCLTTVKRQKMDTSDVGYTPGFGSPEGFRNV